MMMTLHSNDWSVVGHVVVGVLTVVWWVWLQGKPPAALERIENVAVKYFIELCIDANGEKRPSAEQLRAHSLMADLEAPTTPTTAVVKEPAAASPTQVEGPAAVPSLPELPPIAETPPAPPDSGREISVEDVGYVGSLSVPEVMVMLPEGSEMDQDGTTITILHAQMETVPESGDSEPETGKITIDAIFDGACPLPCPPHASGHTWPHQRALSPHPPSPAKCIWGVTKVSG